LSGKSTSFSRSECTRARHRHFMFPAPNYYTDFLTFLRSSLPFFSRLLSASRLFFRARLRTCRRASAVARWARFCVSCGFLLVRIRVRTASPATAITGATTTRVLQQGIGQQVRAPRGALRPRARLDRRC
jgi:hypothetical protein